MPLQYLKKELSYEVDVVHTDKHKDLLQVDSIIFDWLASYAQFTYVNLQYLLEHLKSRIIDACQGLKATHL